MKRSSLDPAIAPVTVHRLVQQDRDALLAHFRSLSSEDRRLRFGAPLSDPPLVRYVEGIEFAHDAAFGVYSRDLVLCGVAHVAVTNEAAEFGVSVLDAHRGKGYGTALFARAATWARNRGIKIMYVHCLSENAVMMHIASKAGMRVVVSHGEADAHLTLPPATAGTVTEPIGKSIVLFSRAGPSRWSWGRTRMRAGSMLPLRARALNAPQKEACPIRLLTTQLPGSRGKGGRGSRLA